MCNKMKDLPQFLSSVSVTLAITAASLAGAVASVNAATTSIENLNIGGQIYDVTFMFDSFSDIFGDPNGIGFTPPTFWGQQDNALNAVSAINAELNGIGSQEVSDGTNNTDFYIVPSGVSGANMDIEGWAGNCLDGTMGCSWVDSMDIWQY